MPSIIKVDEVAVNTLKNVLLKSGSEYKNNLIKLENLIEEIKNNNITSESAIDLLSKYQTIEPKLKSIIKTLDEAEDYIGIKVIVEDKDNKNDLLKIESIIKSIQDSMIKINDSIDRIIPSSIETTWSEIIKNNWKNNYKTDVEESINSMLLSAISLKKDLVNNV